MKPTVTIIVLTPEPPEFILIARRDSQVVWCAKTFPSVTREARSAAT